MSIPVVFSPEYEVDIGEHVFRTEKFRGVYEKLRASKWAEDVEFFEPPDLPWEEFSGFLTPEYLQDLKAGRESFSTLRSELPIHRAVIYSQKLAAGGTYLALDSALSGRCGIHLGGGFHHAYPDHAEGFCYINDIAFAIWKAKKEGKIGKALVVDCDLHQGNGTAAYSQKDPDMFSFSIHQEWLYPIPKERSSLDIGLGLGATDEEYLSLLEDALSRFRKSFQPDVMVYQAGVDPYQEDLLGSLRISQEGLRKRDALVISYAKEQAIPLVITFGGGYPPSLETLIQLHYQTVETALEFFSSQNSPIAHHIFFRVAQGE